MSNIIKIFLENHKKFKQKNKKEIFKLNKDISNYIITNKIYEIKLNAKKEIKEEKNHYINYYTILVDTDLKKDIFNAYLYLYYLLSKTNKSLFLPIDFEFNSKKIALMQMNFDTNFNDRFIFILYPPDLEKYWTSVLIKKILGNKRILKIFHGSDSLDMPYILDELIIRNKYKRKFINSFIDTKYLCEYYNYDNDFNERKCKIYSLLSDQNIITLEKLNQLYKNEENMGPIYNIFIDINNLKNNKELILYTLYDVLYLTYLYLKFPSNLMYDRVLPEIIRLVFLNKRDIDNKYNKLGLINDKMNNYFIKKNNNIKLIDIYNRVIDNLELEKYNLSILLKINYFKKLLTIIIKYVTYTIISEQNKVYLKNNVVFKDKLNVSNLLIKNKYINKIINDIYVNLNKKIKISVIV
jgi:hypothetical protein